MRERAPRSEPLGIQYPFERATAGRMRRAELFWEIVEDHRLTVFGDLETVPAWPSVGGVTGVPDVARPDYGEAQLLPSMTALRDAGCRAIAVMDMYDPGVELARRELGITVLGALDASILAARRAGGRIGWLTAREGVSEPFLSMRLDPRGMRPDPVRALRCFDYELLVDSLTGASHEFVDDFDRAAASCVAAGAEVVIPVCVFFGLLCARLERDRVPGTDVPIIDPFAAVAAAARLQLRATA